MASTTTAKSGLFVTEDGQNLALTFTLVCSLFFLWAMCNGMIDVMDKLEAIGAKAILETQIINCRL